VPEITDAEFRQFVRYQSLGTPDELEKLPKKIGDLEADNKQQRDTIRDLKAAAPADGHVVLPKERAEALARYEALGTPDELANVAGERDELRQKDAARARQDAIRAAVEAAGWPAETVATLEDMRSLDGATFEVEAATNEKGEEVRVPYLTLAGEGTERQKLADFAAAAPQLKGLRTAAAPPQQPAPAGATYTRQTPGSTPPAAGPPDHSKAVTATANYVL
jgi:hypothetical protein